MFRARFLAAGSLMLLPLLSCSDGKQIPTEPEALLESGQALRGQRAAGPVEFIDTAQSFEQPVDFCSSDPEISGRDCSAVDEALDDGQVVFGNVLPAATLPVAECPVTFSGGIYLNWRGHNFIIWGTFIRQTVLRSWPWGEAEYALPPGPHESQDGTAIIWNGVVKGKCFGLLNSSGEFEGVITFSWVRGQAEVKTGGTGTSVSGSTLYSVSDGTLYVSRIGGRVSTGDAAVDTAVNNFIEYGECTEGWVILVNGARVC